MLLVSRFGQGLKSAIWLFPSAAARIRPQQAALDARRQRKRKFTLLAGCVYIEISCSFRSAQHKGFIFSPVITNCYFKKILSVLQPK
jgi:hypothetical protein